MFNFKREGINFNEVEQSLYAWARENGYSNHDVIAMLASTVREQSNLNFWNSMNMLDVLPPAQHFGTHDYEKRVSHIATIRNVLIFLPFAITWAAIAFATSAYGNFLIQNEGTSVSFFAFWQNGFGLLSELWQVDTVAIINTILVVTIIFLTVKISRFHEMIHREFELGIVVAEDQRRALAMELQNYFHVNKEMHLANMSDPIGEPNSGTSSDLRDLAREMTAAIREMKSLTGTSMGTVSNGNGKASHLEQAINDIANEQVGNATGMIDHLGSAVSTLGNEAVRAADRISDIEASILDTSNNLTSIVSGLETSIADVKTDLDKGLAKALDRAAQTIEGVVEEMEITSNSLRSSARSFQEQLETFQRSLRS